MNQSKNFILFDRYTLQYFNNQDLKSFQNFMKVLNEKSSPKTFFFHFSRNHFKDFLKLESPNIIVCGDEKNNNNIFGLI